MSDEVAVSLISASGAIIIATVAISKLEKKLESLENKDKK